MGIDTDYAAPADISDPPWWTTDESWRRDYRNALAELADAWREWDAREVL